MPKKIPQLEALARETVGDGKSPALFFVTEKGVVVTVSRSFTVAYEHWRYLAKQFPQVECAMEGRSYGVICSVAPESDESPRLVVSDESRQYLRG